MLGHRVSGVMLSCQTSHLMGSSDLNINFLSCWKTTCLVSYPDDRVRTRSPQRPLRWWGSSWSVWVQDQTCCGLCVRRIRMPLTFVACFLKTMNERSRCTSRSDAGGTGEVLKRCFKLLIYTSSTKFAVVRFKVQVAIESSEQRGIIVSLT